MKPKIWISKITFSDNTTIEFDNNDIIVIVGPNNSGKSASLKDASNFLKTKNTKSKVINKIEFSKSGSDSDLISYLESISKKRYSSNPEPNYLGMGYDIYKPAATRWWNNISSGIDNLSVVFSKNLTTEERLRAANPAQNIKLTTESPKHPINVLQKSDKIEKQFNQYFKQAFDLDLIVHRNAGNEVPLYVGTAPKIKSGEDRLSESYQIELEKLDLLHEQGDGMRSFVGVLLNAFIGNQNLLFIDEPEAFLHPPQARLLGKMLSTDLPSDTQLFLATHSLDFLKGLLEGSSKNLKIIRIQRNGSINTVNSLNSSEIDSIWSDSLLRHSNILDGLFHTNVIICESDSDSRFYSAVLSAVKEKEGKTYSDSLFIQCGGKHRIPTVIKALKKLNVPVSSICDFDVLNDKNPLKDIYEESGGKWEDIEKDWKVVKQAIESKRPELETKELKEEIDNIFVSVSEKIMPKEKLSAIGKSLKKASAWAHAKQVGKLFIPSGQATQAYENLMKNLKSKNIFVVEVGELESFVKSVGNHGPKWVNEVLIKDLINDPEIETARKFMEEISHY
ncbi:MULTISPECIES: ATP-dependent nuclease [Flavobacteriaceae]|uniref:ATP-dependent nuclease n=1 Tax=Flavobacteriaceae TaxID=49546 RepID=UPI00234B5881|nr:AAA family ATPase [Muricauda sp. SP22]MDC6363286.1 AAA family ATPase [Muricauda sp. SP22]